MRCLATFCALLPLLGGAAFAQESEPADQDTELLGASAAFSLEDTAEETLWVPADTLLFKQPNLDAARITAIDTLSELPILERAGEWSRVLYAERLGWVHPEQGRADLTMVSTESSLAGLVELPSDFEVERRLNVARSELRYEGPTGQLGPYALMTDVTNPRLLARIGAIAENLQAAYRDRYELEARLSGSQAVALFSEEEAYRSFERQVTESNDLSARGHAGGGLAAMFVARQRLDEVTELLVHELTHLINRGALGNDVPPWIEEGLPNDLSYSSIDRQGRLRAGTLSGHSSLIGSRASQTLVFDGPFASLSRLLVERADRQSTPLERLVQLSREEFLRSQDREGHYIESTFLVRFLIDGTKGRYAPGFRTYLAEIAAGEAPDSDRLIALLGTSWRQLELGLGNYLRVQSAHLAP